VQQSENLSTISFFWKIPMSLRLTAPIASTNSRVDLPILGGGFAAIAALSIYAPLYL
jgi:hypothetical protein